MVVGLELGEFPDFLSDHTLLAKEQEDRITEHSRRWVQFVSGLWRDVANVTYQLAFDWDPGRQGHEGGQLAACFLASLDDAHGPEDRDACGLELMRYLQGFGFSPKILAAEEAHRRCVTAASSCWEVRQQEYYALTRAEVDPYIKLPDVCFRKRSAVPESVSSTGTSTWRTTQRTAVVKDLPGNAADQADREVFALMPWWGPGGAHLVPFRSLTAQASAVQVRVVLRPTQLTTDEAQLMAAIAREAESLAHRATLPIRSGPLELAPSQQKTDPQLRWAARNYAANLRRLAHPFLAAIYCLSQDDAAARQVAQAFTNTIREETPFEVPVGEPDKIPSGAQLTRRAIEHGRKVSEQLDPSAWDDPAGSDAPDPRLRRLRYLVDARGAATAFRFPINVRGGIPGIAVKQQPPDFHPGPRSESVPAGHILLGRLHQGGLATVPATDFTKHALITGFTGSGKTKTVLHLVHQFWHPQAFEPKETRTPKPFLILESAKHEYRGLLKVAGFDTPDDLRIYSLGNELCSPFRLNPFQVLAGVRLELHVSRLLTCFSAALPPIGPLASILEEALLAVYKTRGWMLTHKGPAPEQMGRRRWPTMTEFYNAVRQVFGSRQYVGEVRANLDAAISGRIKPLTQLMGSSKGRMLDTPVSRPSAEDLFRYPTILEMNDLNEDDKALVVMFLLTLLREHREIQRYTLVGAERLQHVTVVEEAHNVLAEVSSQGNQEGAAADTKFKAVQAFCSMLTEVRALGECLIIADQSPSKLAKDAMRNTNIQIAHQLRDSFDRDAVAAAMLMTEEQRDFIGKLEPGYAATFYTGLQQATFIKVPRYDQAEADDVFSGRGAGAGARVTDEDVAKFMAVVGPAAHTEPVPDLPFNHHCIACDRRCDQVDQPPYRNLVCDALRRFGGLNELTGLLREAGGSGESAQDAQAKIRRRLPAIAAEVATAAGLAGNGKAMWCGLLHVWYSVAGRDIPAQWREDIERIGA